MKLREFMQQIAMAELHINQDTEVVISDRLGYSYTAKIDSVHYAESGNQIKLISEGIFDDE